MAIVCACATSSQRMGRWFIQGRACGSLIEPRRLGEWHLRHAQADGPVQEPIGVDW
jgi:hypothetical protein